MTIYHLDLPIILNHPHFESRWWICASFLLILRTHFNEEIFLAKIIRDLYRYFSNFSFRFYINDNLTVRLDVSKITWIIWQEWVSWEEYFKINQEIINCQLFYVRSFRQNYIFCERDWESLLLFSVFVLVLPFIQLDFLIFYHFFSIIFC